MDLIITRVSAPALRARLFEALRVYVTAMRYPRGIERGRAPMWAEHMLRTGWRAVAAFDATGLDPDAPGTVVTPPDAPHPVRVPDAAPLVGIAYGYHGAPAYWWDRQVRAGLRSTGGRDAAAVLDDYFELTEIHVHPDAQGAGAGARLLTLLLDGVTEQRVLLSTPEVPEEANRAWQLYRRMGFTDVLRHFTFLGDNRAFAVLGRALPLPRP